MTNFAFIQIVLSAPQNPPPSIVEQVQQNLNSLQEQTKAAVTTLNAKFLETTGLENNVALLNKVEQQAQTFGTQIKGERLESHYVTCAD